MSFSKLWPSCKVAAILLTQISLLCTFRLQHRIQYSWKEYCGIKCTINKGLKNSLSSLIWGSFVRLLKNKYEFLVNYFSLLQTTDWICFLLLNHLFSTSCTPSLSLHVLINNAFSQKGIRAGHRHAVQMPLMTQKHHQDASDKSPRGESISTLCPCLHWPVSGGSIADLWPGSRQRCCSPAERRRSNKWLSFS